MKTKLTRNQLGWPVIAVLLGGLITAVGFFKPTLWHMAPIGGVLALSGLVMLTGRTWARWGAAAALLALTGAHVYRLLGQPFAAGRLAPLPLLLLAAYWTWQWPARHSPDDADDGDFEDSTDDPGPARALRSVVLLTKGPGAVDAAAARAKLADWLAVTFGEGEDDCFLLDPDPIGMAKLPGGNLFTVTVMPEPYWTMTEIAPFLAHAHLHEQADLARALQDSRGAVLVDAALDNNPQTLLMLVKLAAALVDDHTAALVVPTAGLAHEVGDWPDRARQAASNDDLVPLLCNFIAAPLPDHDETFLFQTRGLSMFGLPEVTMTGPMAEDAFEAAAVAVQSTASYLVQRGRPLPPGDTIGLPDGATYRVIASPLFPGSAIGLERVSAAAG